MQILEHKFVLSSAFAALLGGAILFGSEPQDYSVEAVGGNVHTLLGGRGGNIGVQVGEDGLLVIDDQFLDNAARIEAALSTLAPGAPEFLINTHYHGDHTGGNAHFGEVSLIVAHANVRVRLESEGKPAQALPVVTYADGLSIHFNGEEVRLLHVANAHTDGDTVVWFVGSNVVHMGDLYFEIGYPYIDVDGGGSPLGLLAGIDAILERVPEDARIISGHGKITGTEELRVYREMIATIVGRVRELKAEGFSLQEILDARVTEEFDERWTWAFIDATKLVTSVVRGLAD